jgi:polysaccharide pyruvyl transferase CsaB
MSNTRNLVLLSGYYGFGNLGDEAILEEAINEISQFVDKKEIVVLSANPEQTQSCFQVQAIKRDNVANLASLLPHARLLVSGGGGLFQDTKSVLSCTFYASQILMARAFGVPAIVYAQGIGPLQGALVKQITKGALALCQAVTLRDEISLAQARAWGIKAELSADPVWLLEPTKPSEKLAKNLERVLGDKEKLRVGISLRPSPNFSVNHLRMLVQALKVSLPENAQLICLPLQKQFDEPILREFLCLCFEQGLQAEIVDAGLIERPSQWLSLIGELNFMVAMRLHAQLMAISSCVPTVGINYDPKVEALLTFCQQPMLNLAKETTAADWSNILESAINASSSLSDKAQNASQMEKKLACTNVNVLARILKSSS